MMIGPDSDGYYARLGTSRIRRGFSISIVAVLGLLLVYLSFASLAGFIGRLALLASGFTVLVLAENMRRATALELRLTETQLIDSAGRVLADLDDVVAVNRGALAMKPSNGFTLILSKPASRAWAPGLWWRSGRRVGVGGVTSSGASKFMAEQIAMRIAVNEST